MKALIRSPFVAAVLGGLVVAGCFLLLGVTGRRTTRTIVEEGPMAEPASTTRSGLTPHEIYERDAPGVVFVRAQDLDQVQNPFELFPRQQSSISTGSGFLIDMHGRILTNYHLIQDADRETGVTVQFEDEVSRRATVEWQDPNNDLALLQVNMDGVPPVRPLPLGDSTTVQVGDPTLAIGNPFGLDRTLTSGIVSALQRQVAAPNGFTIDNVIQTDLPIDLGNSGGPLIDAAGRVIGINSQIATEREGGNGSVGIAFAVPINTATEFLPRLETGGQIKVAYLGITGVAITGSHRGLRVQTVVHGGPAAGAGLKRGDVVKDMDGRKVASMGEVQTIINARIPGQTITVRAQHGTDTHTFKVTLGSRPAGAPR
jgi:S1-C subfamily serine protease